MAPAGYLATRSAPLWCPPYGFLAPGGGGS